MQESAQKTNEKLKEAFALWENKKGEMVYYSGKTSEEAVRSFPTRLVAFINTVKKNPNSPDITVYVSADKDSKEPRKEHASLWQSTSKAGKVYYTGSTSDKKKLVAFVNGDTQDGKYPAIRAYFKA